MTSERLSKWQRDHLIESIRAAVTGQMMQCDIQLSAFFAACTCRSRCSLAKPFPPHFLSYSDSADRPAQDFKRCLKALHSLPAGAHMESQTALMDLSDDALQLLAWLLASDNMLYGLKPDFCNHVLKKSPVLKAAMQRDPSLQPNVIFRVTDRTAARSFPRGAAAAIAFHGTAPANLHSILRCGLLSFSGSAMQATGAAFGDGIYLSTQPEAAWSFARPGRGWGRSILGSGLRCLLVCEVAEEAIAAGRSKRNDLPAHYVVVDRPDRVRPCYLLIHEQPPTHPVRVFGLDVCTLLILLYCGLMTGLWLLSQRLGWR